MDRRAWKYSCAWVPCVDAGFSASSTSARVRIKGVLGKGDGRVGDVGTGRAVDLVSVGVEWNGLRAVGLLACWRVGIVVLG